jgi:hypothetical protein
VDTGLVADIQNQNGELTKRYIFGAPFFFRKRPDEMIRMYLFACQMGFSGPPKYSQKNFYRLHGATKAILRRYMQKALKKQEGELHYGTIF